MMEQIPAGLGFRVRNRHLPRSTILVLSAIDFPFDLIHSFDSARTNSADCESIYITFIV